MAYSIDFRRKVLSFIVSEQVV